MTEDDRAHWDQKHDAAGLPSLDEVGPPTTFTQWADLFPDSGTALDLACGRGRAAVWLARRGLQAWGMDVSPTAVEIAQELALRAGVAHRCHFEVVDLDNGIPAGPPVDLVLCHLFWDPRLRSALVERLVPGGLLAVTVLSEVDVGPGPYRARTGDLTTAFEMLDVIEAGEGNGRAWLLGRKPPGPVPTVVRPAKGP